MKGAAQLLLAFCKFPGTFYIPDNLVGMAQKLPAGRCQVNPFPHTVKQFYSQLIFQKAYLHGQG